MAQKNTSGLNTLTTTNQPGNRFQLVKILLAENGLLWTVSGLIYFVFANIFHIKLHSVDKFMRRLETEKSLPGLSSVKINTEIWRNWDWSKNGEEWTPSEDWKDSLVQEVMYKFIKPANTILEIGPGAGRWTEYLRPLANHLIIIDISETCIELCKTRFSRHSNVAYHVNNGSNLSFIDNDSVDYIWSFDVFVHIAPEETESYLKECSRVLKKDGLAVIHHPSDGQLHTDWRSRVTTAEFTRMAQQAGFSIVDQFDSWGDQKQFDTRFHFAMITVLRH